MTKTLLIQASARTDASTSSSLARNLAHRLSDAPVLRDLSKPLPQIDEPWLGANFTPADQRTEAQRETLAQSDALIAELQAADAIVIGFPIYNFGVPTALKAWIDLVARVGVTFRYTPDGPVGLLEGKKAYIVVTSGGTEVLSAFDFATPHLRHVLGFIGITEVEIIRADRQALIGEAAITGAQAQIDALAA